MLRGLVRLTSRHAAARRTAGWPRTMQHGGADVPRRGAPALSSPSSSSPSSSAPPMHQTNGKSGSSARAPRPPRQDSASPYPLTLLSPASDIERWPLLEAHTPEGDAFAEASKDGSVLEKARGLFPQEHQVLAVSVPARQSAHYRMHSLLRSHTLNVPRIKALMSDPDDRQRRLLLLDIIDLDSANADTRSFLEDEVAGSRVLLKTHPIRVDYHYWSADEVLSSLLPLGLPEGTPTAFTTTGHLAHLNLRDEYAPYRFLIGQVILNKNTHLRTVVNKLDTIDNQFRFFKMERLAGDDDYTVTVSESGCTFSFDFRTVYWNSRLHAEHDRLIQSFQPYDVVSDVMAGVGPFAVPAAKKGAYVLANDLNPASYESMKHNAAKNRVDARLQCFCEDGRAFIHQSIRRCWEHPFAGMPREEKARLSELQSTTSRARGKQEHERLRAAKETLHKADNGPAGSAEAETENTVDRLPARRLIEHFVMNLPGTALEFLDAYRGAYRSIAGKDLEGELERRHAAGEGVWPMVHVHCFTKDLLYPHEDICRRANQALGIAQGSPHALVAPPSPLPDTRAEHGRTQESFAALRFDDSATAAAAAAAAAPKQTSLTPTPELKLHLVRSVAPNKDMYCLSFRLTHAILFDELS